LELTGTLGLTWYALTSASTTALCPEIAAIWIACIPSYKAHNYVYSTYQQVIRIYRITESFAAGSTP